jgi:hypothetical protein
MGYIRHNAIIVTAWDLKYLKPAHQEARKIFSPPLDAGCDKAWYIVSTILFSPMNGYCSFFVAPDGSKEGWADSDMGDNKRDRFITWMINQQKTNDLYLDWAEVQYGDDDRETKIVRHSDEGEPEE